MSLGVLEAPGAYGCAIAIGEGQSGGQLAVLRRPALRLPRGAAATSCGACPAASSARRSTLDGRRAFVLTLQTREQHIRREKATSNITTNQTLLALAGLATLSWLGPQGLREVGETCLALAAVRARADPARAGVRRGRRSRRSRSGRRCRRARSSARARERGVHPGYALGRDYEGMDDVLLVAVTEKRTSTDVDRLADVLEEVCAMSVEPGSAWRDTPLIFERSRAGRRAGRPPRPRPPRAGASRRRCAASRPPRLPEVAEPEIVRHFTALADRTFGVDTGFYPLGSCTMKHNPRVQRAARQRCPASATSIRTRRTRTRRARSSSCGTCRGSSPRSRASRP